MTKQFLRLFPLAVVGLFLIALTLGILTRDGQPAIAQPNTAIEASNETSHGEDSIAVAEIPKNERIHYIEEMSEDFKTASIIEEKRLQDSGDWLGRLLSIFGIFVLVGIAWLISDNKKRIKWKLVAVGLGLQFIFAVFILWTPIGKSIFMGLNNGVNVLLNFTQAGTNFMFASMVSGQIESANINTALSILPPILFFSSLMTILYHLGIMQFIVRIMASFMVKVMGISGAESLSAVANIFVGQTEAPLVIKPYVEKMTRSELMAVMTGGFATIAGGVMAAYVAVLQPVFPDIAGHLIAASVMSAPAALVIAKLMIPETETPDTYGKVKFDDEKVDANIIDAAARGASEGMKLAINVLAMLIAFVALIAMINFLIGFPSRVYNAQAMKSSASFLQSHGGVIGDECKSPYGSSDTIACTHQNLMAIATLNGLELPDAYAKLHGDSFDKIEKIKTLGTWIDKELTLKFQDTAMYQDCEQGSISACGAVLTKTQSTYWSAEYKTPKLWPLISLEFLFGWLFFPIAWIMGVPLSDCFLVGQLLGEKIAINEFIAYLHLAEVLEQLHYRSIIITIYALCGFANFGSIAIQLGGIGALAPSRRSDIAKLGMRAMIAGTIAAFITGTIAGVLV